MLVWTLRSWPKAQYLARALALPPEAWEIPFLFVKVGGPELSVFEARERPELGGVTGRLKALTKPLVAAAYGDPWARSEIFGEGQIAVAFHPGATLHEVRAMCTDDGYLVLGVDEALLRRGDAPLAADLHDEGLVDGHARLRGGWRDAGADDTEVLRRTLALPVWHRRDHSAAFFLASQPDAWKRAAEHARELGDDAPILALAELVLTELAHPVLARRLYAVAADIGLPPSVVTRAAQLARLRR